MQQVVELVVGYAQVRGLFAELPGVAWLLGQEPGAGLAAGPPWVALPGFGWAGLLEQLAAARP